MTLGKAEVAFELVTQRVLRKKLCHQENGSMDVVVYFRKRRMIFLIGLLLGALLSVVFSTEMLPFGIMGTFPSDHSLLAGLVLILLFYGSPVLWQACCALFLHQPALTLFHTRVGIRPLNVSLRL